MKKIPVLRLILMFTCIVCSMPRAATVDSSSDKRPGVTSQNGHDVLFIYCAAGMRSVIDKMTQAFEAANPVKTEISYDGSNKLLGQMDLTRKGDVYISGDADYVTMAGTKGFVAVSKPLCWFIPVIMVAKGNPRKITTISDLCAPGIRIGQGDEKSAAIGRATLSVLAKNQITRSAWDKNVVLISPTVNDLANAIKLKTIDAAIVWNAIACSYPGDADVIAIDRDKNVFPEVGAAVLTFSKNRKAANDFLDFMTSTPGRQLLSRNRIFCG